MNPGRLVARLTRQSHSNFFYAFVLLPRTKREAMFAVYAFCRIVDDVVDAGADRERSRQEIARWREEIARVFDGTPEHPVAKRLQDIVGVFPIPRSALEDILAGVEMDLDHATYERFEDLYPYCYRVASAVGLCTVAILGHRDARACDFAVDLGVALQLTNILRDVEVDARMGRVYVPQEDLRRFGVSADDLREGRYTPALAALMAFEAARARQYYERAWAALPPGDRRSLFAAEIMGRTYLALLRTMEADRFRVFGRRVIVPAHRRMAIALGCWLRSRLPARAAAATAGRPPAATPSR